MLWQVPTSDEGASAMGSSPTQHTIVELLGLKDKARAGEAAADCAGQQKIADMQRKSFQ
jgi:hypothetical protein